MTEKTANSAEIEAQTASNVAEEVEIVLDEAPKGEQGGKSSPEEPQNADSGEISPEQGVAELRAQMETERRRAEHATRQADEARQQAQAAFSQKLETDLTLLRSAIDNIKRDNDALKAQYRSALEVGDYDKAAEAQEAMTVNAVRLSQIEAGYSEMEMRAKAAPAVPRQSADPVEQFASALSPASADWIRRHPECVTDQRLQRKMLRAHEDAIDDGYAADSPEYFAAIEARLGLGDASRRPQDGRQARQQDAAGEETTSSASAPVARRSSAPPAAPVSRSGAPGSKPNVVRLTAEEADHARSMGYTPKEYAEQKMKLIKEGRMKA